MGVLKNLQNLSDLEFYKCAEKLQDDITDFCLRDFGLKLTVKRNVCRNGATFTTSTETPLFQE